MDSFMVIFERHINKNYCKKEKITERKLNLKGKQVEKARFLSPISLIHLKKKNFLFG